MIDNSQLNWPTPPEDIPDAKAELEKTLYSTQVQSFADQLKAISERNNAHFASYEAFNQTLNSAYLDVAKGQLDRAISRAEFLEKAAGTIATLYTGLLGFLYNADTTKGKPFPVIGITPTIFLGLSIVLAAVYLSYITRSKSMKTSEPSDLLDQQMINDRDDFISWTSDVVLQRVHWLQSAIISLGFGIIFLPVAFLDIQAPYVWPSVVLSLALIMLLPTLLSRLAENDAQDAN